jgi:hypothetical protein
VQLNTAILCNRPFAIAALRPTCGILRDSARLISLTPYDDASTPARELANGKTVAGLTPGSLMTQSAAGAGAPLSSRATTEIARDPYILTLCQLDAPVSIRPPPQLKSFTFFMSRSRQSDGSERLHLHMGYFASKEHAERFAVLLRAAYPKATAMRAPAALLRRRDASVPTLMPANASSGTSANPVSAHSAGDQPSLTDTQVLQVLEKRRSPLSADRATEHQSNGISVLRPEDTSTRRVLKEAVVRGAPVSFAVQLHASEQPLDPGSLPSLSIFRAYTLYATEGQREGSTWYSLRLGFFSDAISAKQVAYYVRSSFASVAVVPISEEERAYGGERRLDPSALTGERKEPDSFQRQIDQALDVDRPTPASPVEHRAAGVPNRASVTPSAKAPAKPSAPPRDPTAGRDSLEQTLEMLASTELWSSEDTFSETGVRHLKVQVRKGR